MKFIKFIRAILDDILMAVGVGFLFYGIYQIYVPASYIVLGVFFLALAFLTAKGR